MNEYRLSSPMRVGIVGAGVMGTDILSLCAGHSTDTVLLCRDAAEAAEKERALSRKIARWTAGGSPVVVSHDPERLRSREIVIEAVPEELRLKRDLFSSIAPLIGNETLVASNSSSLAPSSLCTGGLDAGRFIGLHFFYPSRVKGVVEIIHTDRTHGETVAKAGAFCRELGLRALVMHESRGFVLNRVFLDLQAHGWLACADGRATIEEVDRAAASIIPAGIFSFMEAVGLPTVLAAVRSYMAMGMQCAPCGPLAEKIGSLVREGRGFYENRKSGIRTEGMGREDLRDELEALYVNAFCAALEGDHFAAEELDAALGDYTSCERGPLAVLAERGAAVHAERVEVMARGPHRGYRLSPVLAGMITARPWSGRNRQNEGTGISE